MNNDWKNAIRQQVEEEVRNKTVELAIKARDLLFQEFRRIIDVFYNEYEPVEYIRHGKAGLYGGRGRNTGLHRTYKKFYQNSHDTVNGVYGGVEISNENMATDYDAPNSVVLESFLSGWHGPSVAGIPASIKAYKQIIKYRDKLATNLL